MPNPESSTPTLMATQKEGTSNHKKILIAFVSVTLMIFFLYFLFMSTGTFHANLTPSSANFEILFIADRDEFSYDKESKKWVSRFIRSKLIRENGKYSIVPIEGKLLGHELVRKNRGIELSELKFFETEDRKKRLLTFDDRAGIIYEIANWSSEKPSLVPRAILAAGDGESESTTFKNEWATTQHGKLIVGSWGKEFTSADGSQIISKPQMMYVKVLDKNLGIVEHRNWIPQYEKLRHAVGIQFPGYLVHEAVEWSDVHNRWFFLPRRVSSESYDDQKDLRRGGNILISSDDSFTNILHLTIQQKTEPTRGFSSFKFIPDTHDTEIIALKTEENGEEQKSYITIFDIQGNVLLPETFIGKEKFEGLEIVTI